MLFSLILDLFYCLALVLLSPILLYRVFFRGKYRSSLLERLGYSKKHPPMQKSIWIHGVSVGEIKAAAPLVAQCKEHFPQYPILISSTSAAGKKIAQELYGDCHVISFPLDFSWSVRKYFRHFAPSLVILLEWELWPNFLFWAEKQKMPVLLVNGRLSQKSFQRLRALRAFFPWITKAIRTFAVQSDIYAKRLRLLNIPEERIAITGNMKFDAVSIEKKQPESDLSLWGISPTDTILVAGSTHAPEEKNLLAGYQELLPSFPSLRLILVPRHPERAQEVASWISQSQLTPIQKTKISAPWRFSEKQVLIVDTMGELSKLYALAHIAFIGGSLIPHGGQNFIEPAALGKAVVCGPFMQNFPDIRLFLEQDALIQLARKEDLTKTLRLLLEDKNRREALGERAIQIVKASQGCTKKNILLCQNILGK